MTDSMRAAAIRDFGDTGQIIIEEMPVPEPVEGEVLVRVHAAGLNPIDNKFRSRQVQQPVWADPDFPVIVGWDLSGTVVESDISQLSHDQRAPPISVQTAQYLGSRIKRVRK